MNLFLWLLALVKGKASIDSPSFTGTPTAPTAESGTDTGQLATTAFVQDALSNAVTGVKGDSESSYRTGEVNITKGNIGLGNVDDTADADKPVSTAQQTALNAKAPLASPAFTGSPTAPTPAASAGATRIATKGYVDGKTKSAVLTLSAGNWFSGVQTASVTGVTAASRVFVSPVPDSLDAYVAADILCSQNAVGALIFTCRSTQPSVDIAVNVMAFN